MIERVGLAPYAACVDFMLQAARLLGITYRDANAAMFFLLWPAVTVLLFAIVVWQAFLLNHERRAQLSAAPQYASGKDRADEKG